MVQASSYEESIEKPWRDDSWAGLISFPLHVPEIW